MKYKDVKEESLKDPEFAKEYYTLKEKEAILREFAEYCHT